MPSQYYVMIAECLVQIVLLPQQLLLAMTDTPYL
jgi:hypothetical protein